MPAKPKTQKKSSGFKVKNLPSQKKKDTNKGEKGDSETQAPTSDERFASLANDPRFRRPKRKDVKVKIDHRFKSMFDDSFDDGGKPAVDKYGRAITGKNKENLKRFYNLDDEEEGSGSEAAQRIHQDRSDIARGKIMLESSSEDEDEDSDDMDHQAALKMLMKSDEETTDEELETAIQEENDHFQGRDIPTGEESRRLAVLNLDWDHVKACDLYKVLDSFKPSGSAILSVKVYPSEFGKERMQREELEGPSLEAFESLSEESSSDSDEEEALDTKKAARKLIKSDKGGEYDNEKLRKYQLERLRYFYALVECDSVKCAAAIYAQCDGHEFEKTGNVMDLRYVPDSVEFEDTPRDVSFEVEQGYKPLPFVTSALQNGKVKLTWDQDDPRRTHLTRRQFTEAELDEYDFTHLIASSSDEEENTKNYKSLIENGDDEEGDQEEMQITFTPGLTEAAEEKLEKKKEEKDKDNETAIETYIRKQKEKKERKKQLREESLKKKNEEREAEGDDDSEKEADKKEAELELLMMEEKDVEHSHFDLKEVIKQEKKQKKKKRGRKGNDSKEAEDSFAIDTSDPRFTAIHDSHIYAIDPTNPNFKKTKAMTAILDERRKRSTENTENRIQEKPSEPNVDPTMNLSTLINSVKRKSKSIEATTSKKSKKH